MPRDPKRQAIPVAHWDLLHMWAGHVNHPANNHSDVTRFLLLYHNLAPHFWLPMTLPVFDPSPSFSDRDKHKVKEDG